MAALTVTLAAIYAAIPWWIPTGWLADRLADDLSAQLGAEVTVGDLAVSWSDGLRIGSIAVANPPGFGAGPAVTIEQVRMDFSPLATLLRGRIAWMVVDEPRISAVIDHEGRCNLQQLRPPAVSVLTRHISVRDATVVLSLPDDPDRLTVNVSSIQVMAGRLEQFGRVTMTASLAQPAGNAPMGLTVLAGPAAGDAKAKLSFSFGEVDLAALGLVELLDLPLVHVEGVCGGRLIVPVAPDGNVTDCQIDLRVTDLDAQPRGTGMLLPPIREAGLTVKLNADLATQIVDVQSATLRAPGTALAGKGRFHMAMLDGKWLAGQSIWFRGTVNPGTIAALLRGDRPQVANALNLAGDVDVEVNYGRLDGEIVATATLDASAAELVADGRVLKPAGETLRCTARASCKQRTWEAVFDHTELEFGGNTFKGTGALANIRQLMTDWMAPDHAWTVEEIAREIAGLDWSGQWRITELDSLRRLHPAVAAALSEVALTGPLTGTLRLDHQTGTRLALRVISGPDAAIRAGNFLDKPRDVPLEALVDLHATDGLPSLTDARLELNCGQGRASMTIDAIRVEEVADGGGLADIGGRYRVDRIGELLRYVPAAAAAGEQVAGSVAGDLRVQLAPGLVRGQLTADATQLRVRAGQYLAKRQGQPANLVCNALIEAGADARFDVRASLPGGTLAATLAGTPERWSGRATLAVSNAAWLAEQSPLLATGGEQWHLGGAMTARADLAGTKQWIRGTVAVEADGLDVSAGVRRFSKRRGVPLRVAADGQIGTNPIDGLAEATLTKLDLTLGDNRAVVRGRVSVGDAARPPTVDLVGEFDVTPDDLLLTLAPELRDCVGQYSLAGRVRGKGRLSGGREKLEAECELDATALTALLPTGGVKPAGMPATFEVAATLLPASSTLHVRHWSGRVGSLSGMGDAVAIYAIGPAEGAPTFQSAQSHFRLWTSQAADLTKLLPAAAALAPAGDVEVHGEAHIAVNGAGVKYATATFKDFSLIHRGRRVTLNGAALVEGVNLTFGAVPADRTWTLAPAGADGDSQEIVLQRADWPDGDPRWTVAAVDSAGTPLAALTGFDRIASDALRVSAGPSDATFVMNLQDLLGAPEGFVSLLGRQIDPNDLRQWLADPSEVSAAPLTADELVGLDARADEVLDLVAQLTARLDVRFDADVKLLRNWPDVATGKLLDIHSLAVHTSIKAGAFAFEYQGGFSGGTLIDTYKIDLTAERPKIAAVQRGLDLVASDELQPQIDVLFPGNSLHGSMRRKIEVELSLREVVGNALDSRRPAYPVGTGKGVFLEGVTLGRAAPRFVTRVFPGLNLVEYPYERMVNFTEYRPDGTTYNDMIFDGKVYDIYIEGVTDAQLEGRYDVGMILLGSPQTAEWNHRYRQGRVPVLKFRAKLIGGKKVDERISYPWPNQTMFEIFLKNNYFYRLWLAREK